jgi:hypothetical protein
MRIAALAIIIAALMSAGCIDTGPEPQTLVLQEEYVSPEGWRGERILKNGLAHMEELDSRGDDGRIDLWRFYRDGRLVRELHDLDADDLIEVKARFDPRSGALVNLQRFETADQTPDVHIEYQGAYTWRQEEDRNGDGKVDRVFLFTGKPTILTEHGAEPTELTDAQPLIPKIRWSRVYEDTDFDGELDTTVYSAALLPPPSVSGEVPSPDADAPAPPEPSVDGQPGPGGGPPGDDAREPAGTLRLVPEPPAGEADTGTPPVAPRGGE